LLKERKDFERERRLDPGQHRPANIMREPSERAVFFIQKEMTINKTIDEHCI
jgi:hypothetical protein